MQGWASNFLEQPVTVGGMDARLTGFSPSFELNDVALISLATAQPMVHAKSLRVDIDIPASLRQGKLVLGRLVITGADLAVERTRDGLLRVTGAEIREREPAGTEGFGGWLLSQPRVIIRESQLEWREPDRPVYRFEDIGLELGNDGERHRLNASLRLPEELGERIAVSLDMNGNILRPDQWNGQLFGRIEGVHPEPWLAGADLPGLRLTEGSINASVWSEWRGGAPQLLEGGVEGKALAVNGGEKSIRWEELGGRFRWLRNEKGWSASLGELVAVRDGKRWPAANVELNREGETIRAAANFLRVEDAAALLAFAPGLPAEQRELIAELKPEGDLHDLLVKQSAGRVTAQMRFKDLGIRPWRRAPGFRGLDGDLYIESGGARLELATDQAEVAVPHLFREPLPIARLSGRVLVRRADTGWQVQGQRLAFANADLEGEAQVDVEVPNSGGSPFLDLRSRFRNGRGTSVPRYLPANIMADPAVRWLDRAFRKGRVTEGTALFHGRTSDFPFRDRQGRFEVRFRAEQVELAFRDGWPHLQDVAADVTFDGARMLLASSRARYLDSRVARCRVEIPNMRRPLLEVDGEVDGPASDVLRTLRETPLSQRIKEGALAGFRAEGKSRLDLRLEVPLSHKVQQPLMVGGELRLMGNRLAINERVTIDELAGTLHFQNRDFRAEAIQGRLFDYPAQFAVSTEQGQTRVSGRGKVSSQALQGLEIPFADSLAGETTWQADLVLPHDRARGAELRVHSGLKGLEVQLPAPLGKVSGQSSRFEMTRYLSGKRRGELQIAYGSRFRAAVALNGEKLDRGSFHFGTRMPDLPGSRRLRLTGSLSRVVPEAWSRALRLNGGGERGPALPIEVAMYRLRLMSSAGEKKGRPNPRSFSLPHLDVHVERLEFDDLLLGDLRFRAIPGRGEVNFADVGIRGDNFQIAGEGQWQRSSDRTTLDWELTAPNLGKMMNDLDFVSVIKEGKTRAEGRLEWDGSPAEFSLARLDGMLHVDIREGHIEDVDPGGGRLLGLFSLSALPKRLQLDFSDLFQKGLGFKTIEGDLRLKAGDVLTDNLALDSTSAHVVMSGRTGLHQQDYDMLVSVVPNVSDSLAVAGGLALGPQAGAIIWVLQKLFRSEIDKATLFQYTVKGPWSAPAIVRLSRTVAE